MRARLTELATLVRAGSAASAIDVNPQRFCCAGAAALLNYILCSVYVLVTFSPTIHLIRQHNSDFLFP
jgi:hypothetical protein